MAGRFSVEAVFKAVDKVTAPVNRMQNRVGKFTRSAQRGFDGLNRSIDTVTSTIRSGISGAATSFGLLTAATGVAAVELNRMSVQAEILAEAVQFPVDDLEAIAAAVKGAGFEIDNVVDLVEEMNNKIGESTGLGGEILPVTESLQILGLSFKEISKLSPEEQFKAITNAALAMEDASKAAAAADILLGGEANKIIGVLRAQGGSLDDIIAKQRELSFRTAKSREGARIFREQQMRLTRTMVSYAQEISGLIGLHIGPAIKRTVDWISANKELLRTPVVNFLKNVSRALDEFMQTPVPDRIQQISKAVTEWTTNMEKAWTWIKRIGATIGILFAIQTGIKAASAAMTLFNLIVAANPIVLVGLAIAAVAALVVLKWDEITGAFKTGWARIERDATRVVENFKSIWGGLKQFFVDLVADIAGIFDIGLSRIIGAIDRVKQLGSGVAGFLGFGGDETGGAQSQVVSPQERTARSLSESRTVNTSEVTIRDETGRAEITQGQPGNGLQLLNSGAF